MNSTEAVDPRFVNIDTWPPEDAVGAMLEGQLSAVAAIKTEVPKIARASEAGAKRLLAGGRLIYVGAGTSGRIAVQDGVELGPTFGWPADRLAFVIAGGMAALAQGAEGAEDNVADARAQIAALGLKQNDIVIGVAASGRTPFTVAAVEAARAAGALTIGISNNRRTVLLDVAEHAILADTGAEIIAGSTRMKAGTAQKVILNMLSTAMMLQIGRVYRGLMVDMLISNDKLLGRAHQMVASLTNCSETDAIKAVEAAGRDIKLAVLIAMGHSPADARDLLADNDHNLRRAIEQVKARPL